MIKSIIRSLGRSSDGTEECGNDIECDEDVGVGIGACVGVFRVRLLS